MARMLAEQRVAARLASPPSFEIHYQWLPCATVRVHIYNLASFLVPARDALPTAVANEPGRALPPPVGGLAAAADSYTYP
mmetsp:Transcript_7363/g.18325  ORF Transcript_7363/g.18325 Transcript_7363/m.18325 type:complete len:80 (-) Transcript_7363:712-951(-)